MRTITRWILLGLLLLDGACSSQPAPVSIVWPTATPPVVGTPRSTAEPVVDYVLSNIPICSDLQVLDHALDFAWPNIETAREKLQDHMWGYYGCSEPQAALATNLNARILKPPYGWSQVNWIVRPEGTLGVFYHEFYRTWIYIWMLPKPNPSSSYLVAVRSLPDRPQGWECHRTLPEVTRLAHGMNGRERVRPTN